MVKKKKEKRKDSEGAPLMFLGGIHEHGTVHTYGWEIFAATWLNDRQENEYVRWCSYSNIPARPGRYTYIHSTLDRPPSRSYLLAGRATYLAKAIQNI